MRRLRYAGVFLLAGLALLPGAAMAGLIQADLTINFTPPDPGFTDLTGNAQFYQYEPFAGFFSFTPIGSSINIGTLQPSSSFETVLTPGDPCFGDGSCALAFSFGGSSGGFPAFAFLLAAPDSAPATAPIIPFGPLSPSDPCLPGDPCRVTGPIFAFDAAVDVGTWQVDITRVPEPSSLALLGSAIVLLMAWSARKRAA